ncbi:MAG: hypothetical protein U5K74_03015 [Gemmatimonadaceae bacterium]|nr:hypothetical protein [Gemmatimonadaceae bacterium]
MPSQRATAAPAYMQDYTRMFHLGDDSFDRLAEVPDDWDTQMSVVARLDRRYSEWRMSQGMPPATVLHDALLAAAAPVLTAAGFALEPRSGFDAEAVRSTFVNTGAWQTPRISVYGATSPDQFYGIGVELSFGIRALYDKAVEEARIDNPQWSLVNSATVRMSMSTLAAGWHGPMALAAYYPSLWIFEESELAPAAEFLARRLQDFALPELARITSMRALCDALDTRPLTESPWFWGWHGYGVPLAFELCGHPSLPAVVAEMEAYWMQHADRWERPEMLAFLTRVRERQR